MPQALPEILELAAAPAIYNVVPRDGRWTMVVGDRTFGSFATERLAVWTAIETANEAGRFNLLGSVVIVHDTAETSRIVWTYGYDPFPPTRFG